MSIVQAISNSGSHAAIAVVSHVRSMASLSSIYNVRLASETPSAKSKGCRYPQYAVCDSGPFESWSTDAKGCLHVARSSYSKQMCGVEAEMLCYRLGVSRIVRHSSTAHASNLVMTPPYAPDPTHVKHLLCYCRWTLLESHSSAAACRFEGFILTLVASINPTRVAVDIQ